MGQSISIPSSGGGSLGADVDLASAEVTGVLARANQAAQAFGGGATVWAADSAQASSAFSTSNVRYIPCAHSASNTVEWQLVAPYTGTLQLAVLYAMSAAEANNVRLRLDVLKLTVGDNPTTALTTGTAFTVTPGNNVTLQEVDSGDSANLAVAMTVGQVLKFTLTRLGSDGADTHTGDMRIVEVRAA